MNISHVLRNIAMLIQLINPQQPPIEVMNQQGIYDNGIRITIVVECARNYDCDNIPLLPPHSQYILPNGTSVELTPDFEQRKREEYEGQE